MRITIFAAWMMLLAPCAGLASTNKPPADFGFRGPEIFPIENQINLLRSADLDGDGLVDLLVVNNARSKINILWNQTGKTNLTGKGKSVRKLEINELPPDARFRIDSIASEKRIASFLVTDLNSDGRPDIAYYGEPKELVVQYNQGTNGWSAAKKWPLEDGLLGPSCLAEGDLNGDGLRDIALLGENQIYLLQQQTDHSFGEPEKIPYAAPVKDLQILDINGDGRDDLLLVNWDNPQPFRFRLQNVAGQLGPELFFSSTPIRSFLADDLDGDHRPEIVTIAQNSGRAQLSRFEQKPAESVGGGFTKGQFQVLPLKKTSKARRGVVWADLNQDQKADLLVAEPDSGMLTLYLQDDDGLLGPARSFPSLSGVTDIAAADWDHDGKMEIFLLSADERQVGVTRLEESGRIPFPQMIPVEGRPLAIAAGPMDKDGPPCLAVVIDQDGRRQLLVRRASGDTRSQKLAESFKSNPAAMAIHDINHDGYPDLVILIPYEKIKILRQVPQKDFEELDIAAPGGALEQPWMSFADVDGDGREELLLAQKNFLRAVILKTQITAAGNTNKPGWNLEVKEQINGMAGNSRLIGATALADGKGETAVLFLLDAEKKVLTLCEKDGSGVWQAARNLPLPFTEFTGLQPLVMGRPQTRAVAFIGLNAVAWMSLGGSVWELENYDGYETPIKDGRLLDVISGDLNQDGIKDLVFLETAKNYVDIVSYTPPRQWTPGNRWRVFEERSFRNRRGEGNEPREAVVADATGDGKNDLILLVHDRLLLYPQE